jgi:hypothetical protein
VGRNFLRPWLTLSGFEPPHNIYECLSVMVRVEDREANLKCSNAFEGLEPSYSGPPPGRIYACNSHANALWIFPFRSPLLWNPHLRFQYILNKSNLSKFN